MSREGMPIDIDELLRSAQPIKRAKTKKGDFIPAEQLAQIYSNVSSLKADIEKSK